MRILLIVLVLGCLTADFACDNNIVVANDAGIIAIKEHVISPPRDTENCILTDVQSTPGNFSENPYLFIKYICEDKLDKGKRAAFVQFHNIYSCRTLSHKIVLNSIK